MSAFDLAAGALREQPKRPLPLDRSNPLSRGVTWLFNPALGMYSQGRGLVPASTTATSNYPTEMKTRGRTICIEQKSGQTSYGNYGPHFIVDRALLPGPTGTIALLINTTNVHQDGTGAGSSDSGYHDGLAGKCSSTGSYGGFTFRLVGSGAGSGAGCPQFECKRTDGTSTVNITGTKPANDGKFHLIAADWSQTSGESCNIWLDGVNTATGTNSVSWTYDSSADLHLLGTPDGFWGTFIGLCAGVITWNRKLSPAEHARLQQGSPWQMLQPRPFVRKSYNFASVSLQRLLPISDVSAGLWVPSIGTDLYAMLDESTADDADFDTTPSASTMVVKLAPGSAPGVSTGHTVNYRVKGAGSLTVDLMQGASVIASWTHNPVPANYTTFTQSLTSPQAASISDYTDLRLRFVSS